VELTDDARRVLPLAREEARRLDHNYIGTEHLLLAIVREGDGLGAKVLVELGVDLENARSAVEFIISRGDRTVTGDFRMSPRAQHVIMLAVDEARGLNHDRVGTEHLLLALLREKQGVAAGVLQGLGVSPTRARDEVVRMAGDAPESS
jgi:ATP-dependent Clp protease ATP-binding subunit ClpC